MTVSAQAAEPLLPRVEVGIKGGTDRSLLTTEFWAPLAQKSDRVLYGDIRLMGDNDENREGNLGVGYRQIHNNAVLGIHGWIDRRRTQNNSTFHQLTFGVERLGHIVDTRANIYLPLNQSRQIITPNQGSPTPYMAGNGIFYDVNGLLKETPQYGVDGEVGLRIPIFQKHADAIRVFGGGYHFFRDETVDVTGFRVRTEAQINSAFSVGARFQYDQPRGSQGFLEATVKFPFSAKKLYQTDYLLARLDESPERDVDIVTAQNVIDSGRGKEIINNTTGALQHVIHVDNSNSRSGDGSKDNPFNTLKAAEAVLQDNDILYVNRGNGTTAGMDQGIVITKNNVQLIGSGSNLIYDAGRFSGTTINAPISGMMIAAARGAPVITNTDSFVDNGNGFNASNTGNGIMVTGDNNIISGITVSGASASGIYIVADNNHLNSATISNVSTYDSINGRGIFILAQNNGRIDNLNITDVTANDNLSSFGRGIDLYGRNNGAIGTALIQNIITSGNNHYGVNVNFNSGELDDLTLNNITSHNNLRGLMIASANSAQMDRVTMTHINTYENTQLGLTFQNASNSVTSNLTISHIQTYDNGTVGLYLLSQTNAVINNILVSDLVSRGNSGHGIDTSFHTGSSTNSLTFRNISTTDNQSSGLQVHSYGLGSNIQNLVLNGVNARNNNIYGIHLIASNNVTNHLTATVLNVTATNNKQSGIYINNDSTGTFHVNLGDGTAGSGNNSFFGNNTSNAAANGDLRLDLNNGTINAQNNWWGQANGPIAGQIVNEGTCPSCGTANSSNWLTSNPNSGGSEL